MEGAGRLRMKESDRLRSITQALNVLGAGIEEGEDHLRIMGVDALNGGIVDRTTIIELPWRLLWPP